MQGKIYLFATVTGNVVCSTHYYFDLTTPDINTLINNIQTYIQKTINKTTKH